MAQPVLFVINIEMVAGSGEAIIRHALKVLSGKYPICDYGKPFKPIKTHV